MEAVRQYILSVCAAAMLCGIIKSIVGKKGTSSEIIQMICGIFLAITVVSPILEIRLEDIADFSQPYRLEAELLVRQGTEDAKITMQNIISERAEAYILDKASTLKAQIQIKVFVGEDAPYLPYAATITGNVSPYTKTRLTEMIESDLGIPRGAQQWMS